MNAPLAQPMRQANATWATATPGLSVLIPFHGHDPAPLIAMLDREAAALACRVELVLLDDGGPSPAHSAAAADGVQAAALPALLLTLTRNEGRSKGRNRLAAAARAPRFLFLDSDMAPDAPAFLGRWLALIDASDPPCAVGGFSLEQARPGPAHRLHAALQLRGECAPRRRACPAAGEVRFHLQPPVPPRRLRGRGFRRGLYRLGVGGRGMGHARGRPLRRDPYRQPRHPPRPGHRRGLGAQIRPVGAQLRAGAGQAPGGDLALSELSGGEAAASRSRPTPPQRALPPPRPFAGAPLASASRRHEAAPRRALRGGAALTPINADGTHRADSSLQAKLRRRVVRRMHRRRVARAPEQRMLSLSFDDAPASAFHAGGEILKAKGAAATYFVCAGLDGMSGPSGPYGTRDDLIAADAAGHEIACHTYSHMDLGAAPAMQVAADLDRNAQALTAMGLPAPQTFAYPFGDAGFAAKAAAGRRFRLARGVHHGIVDGASDLAQTPAVGIEGEQGEALAHAWLDRLSARPTGWLILFSHEVEDRAATFGMTKAALAGVIDSARDRGFEIVTVAEGARRLGAGA